MSEGYQSSLRRTGAIEVISHAAQVVSHAVGVTTQVFSHGGLSQVGCPLQVGAQLRTRSSQVEVSRQIWSTVKSLRSTNVIRWTGIVVYWGTSLIKCIRRPGILRKLGGEVR